MNKKQKQKTIHSTYYTNGQYPTPYTQMTYGNPSIEAQKSPAAVSKEIVNTPVTNLKPPFRDASS